MTKESKKQTKDTPTVAQVREKRYDFNGLHISYNTNKQMWQLLADNDVLQQELPVEHCAIYSPSLIRIGHAALHIIGGDACEMLMGAAMYQATVVAEIPHDLKLDGFIADMLDRDTLNEKYHPEGV